MQVCSVTKEDFQPYRSTTLISWALMGLNAASLIASKELLINEKFMMALICLMIWASVA